MRAWQKNQKQKLW